MLRVGIDTGGTFTDFIFYEDGETYIHKIPSTPRSPAEADFPVVQSCALVFCTAFILFMLLADIVAIVSNPKLWHPR